MSIIKLICIHSDICILTQSDTQLFIQSNIQCIQKVTQAATHTQTSLIFSGLDLICVKLIPASFSTSGDNYNKPCGLKLLLGAIYLHIELYNDIYYLFTRTASALNEMLHIFIFCFLLWGLRFKWSYCRARLSLHTWLPSCWHLAAVVGKVHCLDLIDTCPCHLQQFTQTSPSVSLHHKRFIRNYE